MSAARPLSALLLCGGQSRRFGREKGLMSFCGRPLVERLIVTLRRISDDVRISTNDPQRYAGFGCPTVADHYPGAGPLAGLQAGLTAARHDWLAVVACDMPFASDVLLAGLAHLAGEEDAIVPVLPPTAGHPGLRYEPLHALYRRPTCLPAAEALLRRGEGSLRRLFAELRVRTVSREELASILMRGGGEAVHGAVEASGAPDAVERLFANINTGEELARLEALAAETPGASPKG